MEFNTDIINLFDKQWALVTAGSPEDFNTMTISWGGIGTLWSRPVATVYVKPVRYTHEFMERNEFFTVSFYGPQHKKALGILGSRSGRDCDKVKLSGLTPVPAAHGTVTFAEAERTLVCRKLYSHDMVLGAIPEDARETYYCTEEPHTLYIGEILD